jgi:hypothetical protein
MSGIIAFVAGLVVGASIAIYCAAEWLTRDLPSKEEWEEVMRFIEEASKARDDLTLLRRARLIP